MLTDLPLNIMPLAGQPPCAGRHQRLQRARVDARRPGAKPKVADRNRAAKLVRAGDARPSEDKLWWSRRRRGGAARLQSEGWKARRGPMPATRPRPKQGRRAQAKLPQRRGTRRRNATCCIRSISTPATLIAIDLAGKQPERTLALGGRPYDVAMARNGSRLYVSDWAGRARAGRRSGDLRVVAKIAVGEHPNQIAAHPDGRPAVRGLRQQQHVAVIDTSRGIVTETISTALFPKAPEGSTPDALAVSPDGKRCSSPTPTTIAWPWSTSQRPAAARCKASSPPAGIPRPWPSRPTASSCWSAWARETRPSRTRFPSRRRRQDKPEDDDPLPTRFRTSARRFPARCRSCRCPTTTNWPRTPRRCIATAPTPTSC